MVFRQNKGSPRMSSSPTKIDPFFYRLFILTGIVIFLYIFYQLTAVLVPFIVAFILAYLFNPVVKKIQQFGISHRWLAILLLYIFLAIVLGLVLWWLIPLVWKQAEAFWNFLPKVVDYYNNQVRDWVTKRSVIKLPPIHFHDMSRGFVEYLQANYNVNDAHSLFTKLFLSGKNIANVAGMVVLIPILMFYFLYNWDERLAQWQSLIPRPYLNKTVQIAQESDKALMAFVKGQLLVMFLLGTVYAVQLQLIGLNVGLIIGMVAGIASFVPYLGFGVGFITAIVAGFFQFGLDWVKLLMIAGAFMVGQAVEGYVLQPLLLGDKIGLSPLWVMFAVLAGASLMGVVGMLIALPVAAVLNVILQHCIEAYRESKFYQENPSQN